MKNRYRLFFTLCLLLFFVSCKNETNNPEQNLSKQEDSITKIITNKESKALTKQSKKIANNVLRKAMLTPETKIFVNALVTAGLTKNLSEEKGPFTLFAPSDEAFNNIPKDKRESLFYVNNKEALTAVLKTHIAKDNFDSVRLVSEIKKNGGKFSLKTLSGEILTISKKGSDIVIQDPKGNKAILGKSDIMGSNGVVHVINVVLVID